MKYFVPKSEKAEEFNFQTEPKEKFGGLPFGLPTDRYPVCEKCENPMALIAQLFHDEERLDLGYAGRFLSIFQCNNIKDFSICPTWDLYSGANACFVIDSEELTARVEKLPEGDFEPEKEFWITNWEACEDGLPKEVLETFLDEKKYYEVDEADFEEIYKHLEEITKFVSVPTWIQSPEVPRRGSWKFVGQIDDLTVFNFGDAGIGYIFIEKTVGSANLPEGKFFWQCS